MPDGMYSFDDFAELFPVNAFIAACILCCEDNDPRLPNCDKELRAFIVSVALDEPVNEFQVSSLTNQR